MPTLESIHDVEHFMAERSKSPDAVGVSASAAGTSPVGLATIYARVHGATFNVSWLAQFCTDAQVGVSVKETDPLLARRQWASHHLRTSALSAWRC